MPAGYSGTPLATKLGIKEGHRVAVLSEPDEFRELLVDLPADVTFQTTLGRSPDIVVAFHTEQKALEKRLHKIAEAVFPDRMVWLAWPKKTSGMTTDLTGDVVRATVLATKLVDVKVCAISDTWSGLKVVWRKEHRV
ncbi:MAG: DUF3052 domain-containing protein [Acidimicrobiales bacterium]